jgi:ribosome recycling factor
MNHEVIEELEDKLKKSEAALKKDLSKLRTGVASVSLLEDIKIDYYNQPTPLNQVAAIGVPDSRTITIQPWENSVINEIEKAIQKSDLGVNPMSDGKIIRLLFPKLTEERRRELTKLGSKMLENTKIAMRNVRRDINEKLKKMEKDKALSQDDLRKQQDEVQKITDKHIEVAEKIYLEKEKEILAI